MAFQGQGGEHMAGDSIIKQLTAASTPLVQAWHHLCRSSV